MNEDQEAIDALNRAKAKLNIAIKKYPTEMFYITRIIEYPENYASNQVSWAFTRLQEIIEEIKL